MINYMINFNKTVEEKLKLNYDGSWIKNLF